MSSSTVVSIADNPPPAPTAIASAAADALSGGTGKVSYFEGTPIPTSILLVGMLALAARQNAIGDQLWLGEIEVAGFRLHWLTLAFAVSGSLMISRIRIPKF